MENPLQSYYRTKDIYVKLPTGGKWMKNPPNLTDDGEIGVRSMNVKDELMLNIPDALYNGQAIFEFVQSICPDIGDSQDMSLPDVDVIMLASRACSYNKEYPVEVACPHCEKKTLHNIDLQVVLGQIKPIYEQTEVQIDDLVIEMRPNTLRAVNANNIKTSETARMMMSIKEIKDVIDDNLKDKYSENLQQIAAANFVLIADAIVKVTMPDGTVVEDTQHIVDWLSNSNRKVIETLSKQQLLMNVNGIPKKFKFQCEAEDCAKEFETEIEFNPSFFFTNKSDSPSPRTK